jgi:hypothetical protein
VGSENNGDIRGFRRLRFPIKSNVIVRDVRKIREAHDRKLASHQANQVELSIASTSKG